MNELNAMEISGDVSASLKGLLDSTKWRFEDVLITAWLRGNAFSPGTIALAHCH